MKTYRISLIRHGKTKANDEGIYIGKTDYSLSQCGESELCNKLDEFEYPIVDKVYASPLKRCTETAEILFPETEMCIVEDLKELDFGDFEGKTVDELIDDEDYRLWLKGGMDNRPPNGESLNELSARCFKALHEIVMDMMYEELSHTAVITHSGIITNMIIGFGLPKLNPNDIKCPTGEGFEIIVDAKMWQQSQAFEILGIVPYNRLPETEEIDNIE